MSREIYPAGLFLGMIPGDRFSPRDSTKQMIAIRTAEAAELAAIRRMKECDVEDSETWSIIVTELERANEMYYRTLHQQAESGYSIETFGPTGLTVESE